MAESMGSNGTINVTAEIITNARSAITAYKEAVDTLKLNLSKEVNDLIPSNFSGSAADGVLYFYQYVIEPALNKIPEFMDGLDDRVVSISDNIQGVSGIDEQLGTANRQTEGE